MNGALKIWTPLGLMFQVQASHFEGLITTIVGYILLAMTLILCHVSFPWHMLHAYSRCVHEFLVLNLNKDVVGIGRSGPVSALPTSPRSLLHCCQGNLTAYPMHLLSFTCGDIHCLNTVYVPLDVTQKVQMTTFNQYFLSFLLYLHHDEIHSCSNQHYSLVVGLPAGCCGDRCFPTDLWMVA